MDSSDTKILFVLQHVGQPRFSKRISMMQEQGFNATAVAFDRPTPRGRMPSCEVTTLGKIENGKYLDRIPALMKAIPILRKHIKQSDVVYCMGADMSLLAMLASIGLPRRTKIVEVADIVPIQTIGGLPGKIVRLIDKMQIASSDRLVVTAPDFLNIYYRRWVRSTKPGLVVENKIEPQVVSTVNPAELKSVRRSDSDKITIGYYGALRCKWSWNVLIDLMENNPDTHELVLAGRPSNIDGFEETIARLPNVTFLGEYKSPDDLLSLYSRVDLVWACYEPPMGRDYWNHQWARPNRFYEACLYRKPLISRKGCNDSVVVKRHNIGVCIDSFEVRDASIKVAAVTRDQIESWTDNMYGLPEQIYTYTTEGTELANAIREGVQSSPALVGHSR